MLDNFYILIHLNDSPNTRYNLNLPFYDSEGQYGVCEQLFLFFCSDFLILFGIELKNSELSIIIADT